MKYTDLGELVKIMPKGLITIPVKYRRKLGFDVNGLARIRQTGNRLVLEPVSVLEYPVRSYSEQEVEDFFELDSAETKILREKGNLDEEKT